MKKLRNTLGFAIILTEFSHVFCCVLPTIFSVLSLLAGIGLVSAVPLWLQSFHDKMHHWELPIIALSGFAVLMGWALHFYSKKIDCHDHGCEHGPCTPKKKNTNVILKVATGLFLLNTLIYMTFHYGVNLIF